MIYTTADGKYNFYAKVNGLTLLDIARRVNKRLAELNEWPVNIVRPGQYGADTLLSKIGYAVDHFSRNVDAVAASMHDGWVNCFRYWKTNKPWKLKTGYNRPNNRFADEKHRKRSITVWKDLDDTDKRLYKQTAQILLEVISSKPIYKFRDLHTRGISDEIFLELLDEYADEYLSNYKRFMYDYAFAIAKSEGMIDDNLTNFVDEHYTKSTCMALAAKYSGTYTGDATFEKYIRDRGGVLGLSAFGTISLKSYYNEILSRL